VGLISGPLNRFQRRGALPGIAIHDRRAQRHLAHLQSLDLLQRSADALLTRCRMHAFDRDDHLNNDKSIASAIAL